ARHAILATIAKNPGTSISELRKVLGVGWGTVQHHLRLLVAAGFIRTVTEGRCRRLFPAEAPAEQSYRVALLRRARILELAKAVIGAPGRIQRELARELGMSRKTMRRSVDLLVDAGLIHEVRLPRTRQYFPTSLLGRIMDAGQEGRSQLRARGPRRGESLDRQPR
ncbi:MAG TPA: winged helix-turn-helix transcriptional regulator, partial [Candidatus Thermoplasmatota archaeon]|nr:winged helix-turn-helix transcriptional regulator [Candidatus Thermoplasmatota archaeon]